MANLTPEELQEKMLQERLRLKRKRKRAAGREEGGGSLNLNSMMDMMVIILCFLLKSYGEEPIKVLPGTDLPFSTSEVIPKDMSTITIAICDASDDAECKNSIIVNDKEIITLADDLTVEKHEKVGGAQGLIIKKLEIALRDEVEKHRNIARETNSKFEGELTLIADVNTPYRLIAEVMQTSIAAEFKKFRFAVVKDRMVTSGTVPSE